MLCFAPRPSFVFDDKGLEVLRAGKESDNVIVGGRNRWEYSSFVNVSAGPRPAALVMAPDCPPDLTGEGQTHRLRRQSKAQTFNTTTQPRPLQTPVDLSCVWAGHVAPALPCPAPQWEFWFPGFPVLVYFKETQTKPEGQVRASSPPVRVRCASPHVEARREQAWAEQTAKNACPHASRAGGPCVRRARPHARPRLLVPQVHFFPIIFNGKQLYEAMVERCGPSKGSGPK
jgi:hypothetical protein